MLAEQSFPGLNDPKRITRFLIFAIHWRVTAALVGNEHDSQAVFAWFDNLYVVLLLCSRVNDVALGGYGKPEQLMLISIPRVIGIFNFENVANNVRVVRIQTVKLCAKGVYLLPSNGFG